VVVTSSYEARRHGVKTGMMVWEARQACPTITFVTGNNARYTHTCTILSRLYRRFTPDVEVYSVDEAFLDVTTTEHLFGDDVAIARQIKHGVLSAFGLNCTVGIGPNVLLAKLASDLGKPNGLKVIRQADIARELEDLPVGELWGIGRKTAAKLQRLGIATCGELGRAPASLLRNRFGIIGETLRDMGCGICHRPVHPREDEPKSIGHSMTLPADIWERADLEANILKLSEMVGRRARRHGYRGGKVTLTVRYTDFETFSRQTTLPVPTNDTHEIYHAAMEVLDTVRLRSKVRLLGVSISSLVAEAGQMYLMEDERKRRALLEAMDEVNDRYGERKIIWGTYLDDPRGTRVISPAWRPDGVRHAEVR